MKHRFLFPALLFLAGPVAAQPDLAGSWVGTLDVGVRIRIVFNISADSTGGWTATMDSPDQGARGIPVSAVSVRGDSVRIEVAVAQGAYDGVHDPETDTIEGRWSQSGMLLALRLERTGGVQPPARPQEPKPPFPYRSEDVRIDNAEAGITLAGTLTIPGGNGPFPAAVLVSGSGPQNRDEELLGHKPFLVLADHLTRSGIAVLRYDDRGIAQSTGDFATATSDDFASDALSAVAFLKALPEVDGDRIGIIGHSEGGIVGPIAAVRSDDVAFLVLLAGPGIPGDQIILLQTALIGEAAGMAKDLLDRNRFQQTTYFDIVKSEPDTARAAVRLAEAMHGFAAEMTEEEREATGLSGDDLARAIEAQARQLNSPWFRFFLTHDPATVLRRVRCPVLALIGMKDLQVPYRENIPAIEAALRDGGNTHSTVQALEGLNHLFQTAETGAPAEYAAIEETLSPRVLEMVSRWILDGSDRGFPRR